MPKNNFEKLKLEIQSIENTFNEKISKFKASMDGIDKEIESLIEENSSVQKESSEMMTKLGGLQGNLSSLESTASTLSQEVEQKESKYSNSEEEISELKHKKITLETEIAKAELKSNEFNANIRKIDSDLQEVKDALVNAESLYEEKVKSIETEISDYTQKTTNRENQFKILKVLLEDGYVRTNFYNVMKTIGQSGVDTLDKLQRASAVAMPDVKETLVALSQKGIIKYDSSSGSYSILKELNI